MMADVQVLVRQYQNALIVGAANGIAQAARRSTRDLPSVVRSLGQALGQRALPERQLAAINKGIAQRAQGAVVGSYVSRLPRRGTSGGELSGTLGPALANRAMISATSARVISFVNTEYLNTAAKHWYRINYGAMGPNLTKPGGREPATFVVNINGRPFIALRDDLRPDPVSWLPQNFFWTPDDRFVASRGPALPTGRGARAARLFDPGLEVIANEMGPAYDQFLRRFVADGAHRARLADKNIHVIADLRLESYGYEVSVH